MSDTGGHINPAVTLACFLTKKISLVRGFLYIAVQCGGAAIASIILKGVNGSSLFFYLSILSHQNKTGQENKIDGLCLKRAF